MSEFSFCLTEPRTHIRRPLAPYGAIKSRDLGCWVGANLGAADAPSKTTMFLTDPNRSKYLQALAPVVGLEPALDRNKPSDSPASLDSRSTKYRRYTGYIR
jgi:hypothetical protein